MRRFRNGRVDYIRSTTLETLNWCRAMMLSSNVISEEKFYLFNKAVDKQTTLMVDTILGRAYDCHLMALRNLAEEEGFKAPLLFQDKSYTYNNHIKLLTSQVKFK
jgi:carnitine O-octanoyltransferase